MIIYIIISSRFLLVWMIYHIFYIIFFFIFVCGGKTNIGEMNEMN